MEGYHSTQEGLAIDFVFPLRDTWKLSEEPLEIKNKIFWLCGREAFNHSKEQGIAQSNKRFLADLRAQYWEGRRVYHKV